MISRVQEFCHTWERAVKTICLYPPTNPLPDELGQGLEISFGEAGIGKPVEEAEGGGGEEEEVERKE